MLESSYVPPLFGFTVPVSILGSLKFICQYNPRLLNLAPLSHSPQGDSYVVPDSAAFVTTFPFVINKFTLIFLLAEHSH